MSRLSKEERKRIRREAERAQQEANEAALRDPVANREELYRRCFGECRTVVHDVVSIEPHVDVYIHGPKRGERNFFSLVTGGLSQYQETAGFGRSELVFYCKEDRDEYVRLLHSLAHAIIEDEFDVSHGHTMALGDPPEPFIENTDLSYVLLHETGIEPECDIHEEWKIEDEPVFLLNVMPITEAEWAFIRDHGIVEFSELVEDNPAIGEEVFQGPRVSII